MRGNQTVLNGHGETDMPGTFSKLTPRLMRALLAEADVESEEVEIECAA